MNTTTVKIPIRSTTKENSAEKSSEGDDGDMEEITEAAEVAVPFAITVIVIIILVSTVIYAKFRKSRMRRHNQSRHVPTISGGVPLSTAAYHNEAFRQHSNHSDMSPNMYSDPPPMYSGQAPAVIPFTPVYPPTLPHYSEAPPKYEEVVKNTSTGHTVIDMGTHSNGEDSQQNTESEQQEIANIANSTNQTLQTSETNTTTELPQTLRNETEQNMPNSSIENDNSLPVSPNATSEHITTTIETGLDS